MKIKELIEAYNENDDLEVKFDNLMKRSGGIINDLKSRGISVKQTQIKSSVDFGDIKKGLDTGMFSYLGTKKDTNGEVYYIVRDNKRIVNMFYKKKPERTWIEKYGFKDESKEVDCSKKFKFTDEQMQHIFSEMRDNSTPVRFLINGQTVNIETCCRYPKGINVIYLPHYWDFPRKLALEIASWIGAKCVFGEDD
jgi:hypothetical protein